MLPIQHGWHVNLFSRSWVVLCEWSLREARFGTHTIITFDHRIWSNCVDVAPQLDHLFIECSAASSSTPCAFLFHSAQIFLPLLRSRLCPLRHTAIVSHLPCPTLLPSLRLSYWWDNNILLFTLTQFWTNLITRPELLIRGDFICPYF